MLFTIKDNTLKIDMGDHYYTGQINPELFPEEIRDNYMDILRESFVEIFSDEYSVTNNFDDKNFYVINFSYNTKPFCFKRKIEIPVTRQEKDFKDYTNERIEKLELLVNSLIEDMKNLKESDENESDEDESNEDESDEEVEIVKNTKGGKKVPVAQMKNSRLSKR